MAAPYRGVPSHGKEANMDRNRIALVEREARRLRAQYAGDRLVVALLALDTAIRRLAHRIGAAFEAPAEPRSPCR